jgi:hypothetical protein
VTEYRVKLTGGNVQDGVSLGNVGDAKNLISIKSIPGCVTLATD